LLSGSENHATDEIFSTPTNGMDTVSANAFGH
jgi:hypothetical protein